MGTTQLFHMSSRVNPQFRREWIWHCITEADFHKLARQLEELDASPYDDFDDYLLKLYLSPVPSRCPLTGSAPIPLSHKLWCNVA
jgi:hypothetical protein